MRIWRKRLFYHPQRHRRRNSLLLSGAVGIGIALLVISFFEAQLSPVLNAMASAKVSNVVTRSLDGAIAAQVEKSGLTYSDIITMEKDDSGRITALTSNMAVLNHLRTGILGTAVEAVEQIDTGDLAIPMGNLTGVNFLSGRGFSVPVEVVSVGSAHAEYKNLFTDAGINQTRHQIVLDVTVTVKILLPGDTMETDVTAQVPVAETVIVGAVPDTYLQVGQ